MNLLNNSENLKTFWPVLIIACVCTWAGSYWIDRLYAKELDSNILSFPKQVARRARFRKPFLFLLITYCISQAWNIATGFQLIYFIIAIVLLVFVTVTDFEQYVIFDSMLLPFALCGICYTLHMHLSLTQHIIVALGCGLLFILLTLLTKGSIGGGDIKLITTLGLWLDMGPLLSVIAYGFITGGVAALFLLITKQKQRYSYFAYGPYFALSGVGVLLGIINRIF